MTLKLYPSKKAAKLLLNKFNKECDINTLGTISIWVTIIGKDHTRYGNYKRIQKSDLYDRRYVVEYWDGAPTIVLVDTIFNHTIPQSFHALDKFNRLYNRRRKLRYAKFHSTTSKLDS